MSTFTTRLRDAVDRHPRWATRLTCRNVLLFALYAAIAWSVPHIKKDGTISDAQAATLQQWLVLLGATVLLAFVIRTTYDIRRHRQVLELLANEQAVRQVMDQHHRFVTLHLYAERMGFGRPDAARQPSEWQKYQVARAFRRYLAALDERPWSLNMLRRRNRQMWAALAKKIQWAPLVLTFWLVMPFKVHIMYKVLKQEHNQPSD